MRVVALVTDLMDRSRLTNAIPDVTFALAPDAEVVILDLARGVQQVASVRAANPTARIVCYGPHVDDEAMATARTAGADVVVARSQFFRSPRSVVAAP